MKMENNSYKTEESPLKNHPLYENREGDLYYTISVLQKQIEELNNQIKKLQSDRS